MLFWIFVIALVIGIVCWIVAEQVWKHRRKYIELLEDLGKGLTISMIIFLVVNCIIFAYSYIGVEANIAQNKQIYESLTYQLENNIYDNDNDLGKKELYNQIQDWNGDLAYYQALQDDFWIGIYYPDIFGQFEFIELSKGE